MAEHTKGASNMTEMDIAVEALSLTTAGSGTTAITMTYMVWVLLTHPDVSAALQKECATLPPNFNDLDLEKLVILNAVINETLRLYGAAPGSLPRTVPPGGFKLGDYYLAGGLTVNTQAYSIHRDPKIFAHPERYVFVMLCQRLPYGVPQLEVNC
jgi:cytochrome P450